MHYICIPFSIFIFVGIGIYINDYGALMGMFYRRNVMGMLGMIIWMVWEEGG